MYSRAEGITDYYWPWAVFFRTDAAQIKKASISSMNADAVMTSVTQYSTLNYGLTVISLQ